ncbi:MAG: hypothetical protein R3E39_03310 [Anaerolineae bacterium]
MQFPNSIREINSLADDAKHTIYATLLPDWLFTQFGINRDTLTVDGLPAVEFRCPVGTRAFEMTVKSHPNDIDPILYVNIADTFTNQLLVLLVIVNDLNSPRFDVDVDETGKSTHLGTSGRNVKAELAAMGAGLSRAKFDVDCGLSSRVFPILSNLYRRWGMISFSLSLLPITMQLFLKDMVSTICMAIRRCSI